MSLKKDIDDLFVMVTELERRQKKGESATQQEVDNFKSLTLVLEAIAECMLPEKMGKEDSNIKC